MSDCVAIRRPFFCPTKWMLWRQILGLLPPGRAWQTHEEFGAYPDDVEPDLDQLTVMQQYWAGFAEVLEYLHQRACGLLAEMFCHSVSETLPEWQKDLGMPDDCERYENICEKFIEDGGARCEDFVAAAAARGWSITCRDCGSNDPARAGVGTAGCAVVCSCQANTVWITIDTANSPAYVAPAKARPRAGCARVGCNRMCDPDVSLLMCVIDRIRHAHLKFIYEVV